MASVGNSSNTSPLPSVTKQRCTGCKRFIQDKFMLKVADDLWHENCLRCYICAEPLSKSCYLKDHKLYCKEDYDKLFGTKCDGCGGLITSKNELVMKALTKVYHLSCFFCGICKRQLKRGDEFVLKDANLYCKVDYENIGNQPYPTLAWQDEDRDSPILDIQKRNVDAYIDQSTSLAPKRQRTVLNSQQRKLFYDSFEKSSKPCKEVRDELSRKTGLSSRVVQVWFQNQRAKLKKENQGGKERKGRKGHRKCSYNDDNGTSQSDVRDSDSSDEAEHLRDIQDEIQSS